MNSTEVKEWDYENMLNSLRGYWHCCLTANGKALSYLQKRGINEETAAKFQLGYTDYNRPVRKNLFSMGNKEATKIFKELGFLRDDGKDKFFNRLVIPFYDLDDKLVGFTGRLTEKVDKAPKYLRTKFPEQMARTETAPLCWHNCRDSIKQAGEIIVVEGPFDALAMQSGGYLNTVAMQGTGQLKQMKHFYADLINTGIRVKFLFDRDRAGDSTRWDVLTHIAPLINDEFGPDYVAFPNLPLDAPDPSEVMSKKDGLENMQNIMKSALTLEGELERRLARNPNSVEKLAANANRINMILKTFEVESDTCKLMQQVIERQTKVKVAFHASERE